MSLMLALRGAVFAGDAERAFLREGGAIWSSSERTPQVFDLTGAFSILEPYFADTGISSSNALRGYRLDLNGDKRMEYLIQTPLGGTGGPHYVILARDGEDGWRLIGAFQGHFHLLPPSGKSAWRRIVAVARGGAGVYGKSHLEFSGGAYRVYWEELLEGGQVIREGEPKKKE